jgi:hypothetical protein
LPDPFAALRFRPQPRADLDPSSTSSTPAGTGPGERSLWESRLKRRPGATAPPKNMLSTVIILSALVIVMSYDSSES